MALLQIFVGVDVSAERLDVHLHPLNVDVQFANSAAGWEALCTRLAEWPQAQVGAEASGGYEGGLLRRLDGAGFAVYRLDAGRVRQFARAAGKRAKNDRIDARQIARYLAAFTLNPTRFDPRLDALAEIVTYRRQLVEQRTAIANQARLLADRELARISRRRLAGLDALVARLDRRLAETIAAEPALAAKAAVLTSLKGVAATAAATLIALLPELGTLDRRKIAALVGVCPYDFDTGRFRGQRHIAGGRAAVRNALYMPTLVAIRHEPVIRDFYQRHAAGKDHKKPVVIAAMRKLLTILNARMRDHIAATQSHLQMAA